MDISKCCHEKLHNNANNVKIVNNVKLRASIPSIVHVLLYFDFTPNKEANRLTDGIKIIKPCLISNTIDKDCCCFKNNNEEKDCMCDAITNSQTFSDPIFNKSP